MKDLGFWLSLLLAENAVLIALVWALFEGFDGERA